MKLPLLTLSCSSRVVACWSRSVVTMSMYTSTDPLLTSSCLALGCKHSSCHIQMARSTQDTALPLYGWEGFQQAKVQTHTSVAEARPHKLAAMFGTEVHHAHSARLLREALAAVPMLVRRAQLDY